MSERISNFKDFYQFYLKEHSKLMSRIFHFVGTALLFVVIGYVIYSGKERFLWYIPIFGWGVSALSHYVFEKNSPTTLKYPVFTLVSDFRMFFELLTGKTKFKS